MEDCKKETTSFVEPPEKRLERLLAEEQVLISVIKQIKLQLIELETEKEELVTVFNKLREEEGVKCYEVPENIANEEKSKSSEHSQSFGQLSESKSFESYVPENIGIDFDEVVNSAVCRDYVSVNLDNIGMESEFDDELLVN